MSVGHYTCALAIVPGLRAGVAALRYRGAVMSGLLTPDQWDALRNWVGTVGGVVALTIAARTYRRNVRTRREEQARLVYSRITHQVHHLPGAMLDMLPNGARIGGRGGGTTIVLATCQDEKARELALVPVIQVTARIHNGSKELIGPAKIQMVNSGLDRIYQTFSVSADAVEPETDYVVDFRIPQRCPPRAAKPRHNAALP